MLPTVLEPFVYPQSNVPCSARSTTLNRKNWQGYLKSLLSTGARPSPSSPRRFPLQALILKEEQLQSPPRAQDLCCECSDSPFINRTLISPKTPNSIDYINSTLINPKPQTRRTHTEQMWRQLTATLFSMMRMTNLLCSNLWLLPRRLCPR